MNDGLVNLIAGDDNSKTNETVLSDQMTEDLETQTKVIDFRKAEHKKIREELLKAQKILEEQKNKYDKEQAEVEQMKENLKKEEIKRERLEKVHEMLKCKHEKMRDKLAELTKMYEILALEIIGKWKMWRCYGREEYEKHRLADDSYSGDRAKIDFENREFTYDNALRSYVDNNTEDPSFMSDWTVNKNERLVYGHYSKHTSYAVNVLRRNELLFVGATIFKNREAAATCGCFYRKV